MDTQQLIILIILIGAVIAFLSGKISSCVVALGIMCALYITKSITAEEMVAGFSNSAVILTMSMLIISGALLSCGFAQKIGDGVLKIVHGERNVMMVLFILGCFLSMFISAMGTISVLTPLAIGICQSNPKEYHLSKLMLPCAIACTAGGTCTSIGKPPNIYINSYLQSNGYGAVGFFEFAKVGLPIVLVFCVFLYFFGYKLLPNIDVDPFQFTVEKQSGNKTKVQKILCVIIFFATVGMLMLENVIGIPSQISSLLGACAMIVFGVVSPKEAFRSIQWETIFLLAGILPLAKAMVKSGLAASIANLLIKLLGNNPSPLLVTAVLFLVITLLTEFMSNVAACSLFAPIGMEIATTLGFNPVSILLAIAIAGGCSYMTPVGSPPEAFVMQYGGYKFKDYFPTGIFLNLISWLIGVLMISICWPY